MQMNNELAINTKKLKFKLRERKILHPVYMKHVSKYLMRVIKTQVNKGYSVGNFMENLNTYFINATCHEIAFNQYYGLEMLTHQNNKGFEAEYCDLAVRHNMNVSRDKRVRLIWRYLYRALLKNPNLDGIEPFEHLGVQLGTAFCPFCNTMTAKQSVIGHDEHDDGTLNTVLGFEMQFNECEHFLGTKGYYTDFNHFEDVLRLHERIHDWNLHQDYEIEDQPGVEYDDAGETDFYYVKDKKALTQHMFKKLLGETIYLLATDNYQPCDYGTLYRAKVDLERVVKGLEPIYHEIEL